MLRKTAAPEDPDLVYVFGSNGGRDTEPGWLRNVTAEPEVTVEIGAETLQATAQILGEPERSDIFSEQARTRNAFADYQAGMSRRIPVVALRLKR